jgi:hypothetical protein
MKELTSLKPLPTKEPVPNIHKASDFTTKSITQSTSKKEVEINLQNYIWKKYSFILFKTQGGACICVTKQLILIGTFSATQKMSNGVPQNPGELNKRVESLAKTLMNQGFWFVCLLYQS